METVKKDNLSLDAKEKIGITVIKDALNRFNRGAIVWSAGKDSTVALHLLKRAVEEEGLDMLPAIFVDHGDHFP
ncbi:MAG: phosphoadenosine phosphosulfate reductase family protein, partial [Nitrososphaeria archaeon]